MSHTSWQAVEGEHEHVLERIAAHDQDGARAAMQAHLDGVAHWWREHSRAGGAGEAAPA